MLLAASGSALLLYLSLLAFVKRWTKSYHVLTVVSLSSVWANPYLALTSCGPLESLQRQAIACASMHALGLYVRRKNPPAYALSPRPSDAVLAFKLLTELRFESFSPTSVRAGARLEKFSEPAQLAVHIAIFAVLQCLPQVAPVMAFGVLLAVYIIWTSLQLVLRYQSSPALFGPLYLADSIESFWTETWHNVFAAPCRNLAFEPTRRILRSAGLPDWAARVAGVLAVFGFMGAFHVYTLTPVVSSKGLWRIWWFFFANGVLAVGERAYWRGAKSRLRTLLAWFLVTLLASWTAAALDLPRGLSALRWEDLCYSRET
ncbi:hypothetical protein BDY21DRAFT_294667 [Lineolata rhizophorae]|uniref:Wax synthase domain-containing protein n=1 Tax=Lineolata rhizophorae TaxID=578093 RepID=A0A6A6NL65_9PEZI|nr:hypothetical protein BDY21DRAFT_294667 [Lineolata rhizophorae]